MSGQTIRQIQTDLRAGAYSCEELVREHLDRMDRLNPKLNIMITSLAESALTEARRVDARLKRGEPLRPLEGIPYTAKDMFLIEGTRTTAASRMLDSFVAPFTATAITKLQEAGAICIAKVNQDEFGHGSSSENSAYGPTHNPRDTERVPGGSSGGSAAAVAAGIGIFSIGTDTGGSSRQPAAYCGVVGVKPTYGRISRSGVIAMASSLDTVGILARDADEAQLVMTIMAGRDELDATTIAGPAVDASASTPKKAGVIKEYMEGLADDVAARYRVVYDQLREAGWKIEEVSLPNIQLALPCYYILTPSEISSNLERYDGIRYGSYRDSQSGVDEDYAATRGEFLGAEVRRRILAGTYALSAGYYDAYYKKAMQVRTKLIEEFTGAFEDFDILIGPIAPAPAFRLGEHTSDPREMYLVDIMSVSANLAGIPSLSLPIQGLGVLPLGLQILAPQMQEAVMFAAARQAEAELKVALPEVAV